MRRRIKVEIEKQEQKKITMEEKRRKMRVSERVVK